MGWLSKLFRRGPSDEQVELAMKALSALRKVVGDARTVAEMRRRIELGARKGDLDDIVVLLNASDAKVQDFIRNG